MTSIVNPSVTALAIAGVSVIGLTGCSDGSDVGGSSMTTSADCPPTQKGNGIRVSSRYDYEDLLKANRWRTEMFPRNCAGQLAALVPDMPAGYGVRPTNKPYVMTNDQVYVAYASLPDPLYLEEDVPNIPPDLDAIEYEIVRFSTDEITKLRDWMTQNPPNYLIGDIQGESVYLIGGFGSGRSGKGDRLATSLHALLDDNIVVRVSHKSLFSQHGGLELSPLVQTVMGDIIHRSK